MRMRQFLKPRMVSREVEQHVDALPDRNIGSQGYDPWGLNLDSTKIAYSSLRWLYEKYFRVQAHGLEHIPAQGRLLIIGNHSGQVPLDGALVSFAAIEKAEHPRLPRAMIERWFPSVPFVGNILSSFGAVVGDPVNCVKMLERDETVVVFPEGIRGSGKPYRLRYQLQGFGHGFMHLAMEHSTPIVPVGIVGCEETMPSLGNVKPLARLLKMPYFPFAAPLPLPARVVLNFGEPMHFANDAGNAREVADRVEQVSDAIRGLIDRGIAQRTSIF